MTSSPIAVSCCVFGPSTEEVHVAFSDCPIARETGKRVVVHRPGEPVTEEATCLYRSGVRGKLIVPPCPHYHGVDPIQAGGRTRFAVRCAAPR